MNFSETGYSNFIAVAFLVVTPNEVEPSWKKEKIAVINLCLHLTTGDPQWDRTVPEKPPAE